MTARYIITVAHHDTSTFARTAVHQLDHQLDHQLIEGRDAARQAVADLLRSWTRTPNAQIIDAGKTGEAMLDRWYGDEPLKIPGHLSTIFIDFAQHAVTEPEMQAQWTEYRMQDEARQREQRQARQREKDITRMADRVRQLNADGALDVADPDAYATAAVAEGRTVAD